ncbi:recombinase family protein [Stratiformator vulcanicus]|uniref:Recombinase domain-containing protein n=1 Tax=Stratiformator vulcanicus TaxID=2527980 RepID=A0A517R150_9PLAN|nr:recombinase family protein [Stratiformator vulcanicus]QDT37573.1 hypothetical protein Pan189_19530 [Stratiformator vulcanicus]
MYHPNLPLVARDGQTLRVVGVCRISTEHQDAKSLQDQEALYRSWVDENYDGAVEFQVICSRGSGELLETREQLQLMELVESATCDLVIVEDLGRICRRFFAHSICENAQDTDTRVIALNDNVDTANEGWEINSLFSSLRHESYNKDTSKRIKRSHLSRFQKGGIVQCLPYGYRKPHPGANDEECWVVPEARPVWDEVFRRLEEGHSNAEIADWLNDEKVPVGPHVKKKKWDGTLLGQNIHNPILKGVRERNRRETKRENRTGRRISVKAPPEALLQRDCPNLVIIDPDRYDLVIRAVDARNAHYARGRKAAADSRKGVPRKRTVRPGQSLSCGICGRVLYYGGHGQNDRFMCSGARDHHCWNGVTCSGFDTSRKVLAAVIGHLRSQATFIDELRNSIELELQKAFAADNDRLTAINKQRTEVAKEIDNITLAVAKSGGSNALLGRLSQLENEERRIQLELDNLHRRRQPLPPLPSEEELNQMIGRLADEVDRTSPEFHRIMSALLPDATVMPVRQCLGNGLGLRLTGLLHLVEIVPGLATKLDLSAESYTVPIELDLFDPPQPVVIREDVIRLTEENQKERDIAKRLHVTQPAVKNA